MASVESHALVTRLFVCVKDGHGARGTLCQRGTKREVNDTVGLFFLERERGTTSKLPRIHLAGFFS